MKARKVRGRKDHYLPQGYLRGFIDPSRRCCERPLWHLDLPSCEWSERSTGEVGHLVGFYDYSSEEVDLPDADSAFMPLEDRFPVIRERIHKDFDVWTHYRKPLLRFMNMLAVRSPLAFRRKHEELRAQPAWVVEEIISSTELKVRDTELSDEFIKNRTIVEMRASIRKDADYLTNLDWALRYSFSSPFVICEQPVILQSPIPGTPTLQSLRHPDALLTFPLSRSACLFGSSVPFLRKTDEFCESDMRQFRRNYRDAARRFLISPLCMEDLTRLN